MKFVYSKPYQDEVSTKIVDRHYLKSILSRALYIVDDNDMEVNSIDGIKIGDIYHIVAASPTDDTTSKTVSIYRIS